MSCVICGEDHASAEHPVATGDLIWVGTSLYLSHGEDDFVGGRARVTSVKDSMSAGVMEPFITIAERPGTSYNWSILAERQDELASQHGDAVAHGEPDTRPEFNEWAGPGDFVSETTFDRDGNPNRTSRVLGPGEHIA